MKRKARNSSGAFTLLEVLLSLALVGLLLIALNTFVFSMGELWGRNSDRRLFDQLQCGWIFRKPARRNPIRHRDHGNGSK